MSRFALITRHPSDCAELRGLLEPCGIKLRPYPVLRIEDSNDDAGWRAVAEGIATSDGSPWLVLASPLEFSSERNFSEAQGATSSIRLSLDAVF